MPRDRHASHWDPGYSFCSGDFSERDRRPDDEEEAGDPCACGSRCAESDYQGNARRCPRAFCRTDERYIADAIAALPETYRQVRTLLARSQQQEERVSGSREAPLPLAADVEAFLREIVRVAVSWEDQVMAVARLSDYPDGPRRDTVALADAARTLHAHLTTLLSLAPETKQRFVPPSRLDAEPDLEVHFDTAGDAWEFPRLDGTDAGLEFLALHGRARGMCGLTRRRRRITEVACDGCHELTLVQREAVTGGWEPAVRCSDCPNAYTGLLFTHIMARVYEAQVAALEEDRRRKAHAA